MKFSAHQIIWNIRHLAIVVFLYISNPASAATQDTHGADQFGADYAFLDLMALSTDFAASHYRIDNDSDRVYIDIYRLPKRFTLAQTRTHTLKLEAALAYQDTRETVSTYSDANEYIDAQWITQGFSLGVIDHYQFGPHIDLVPSIRLGITRMQNIANYYGTLTQALAALYDGTLLNWTLNARLVNTGLGLRYHWKYQERENAVRATIHRISVISYNESNAVLAFRENANLLNTNAEFIVQTHAVFSQRRIDMIYLLGNNYFFGENRHTLGNVTSYQAGIGAEISLKPNNQRLQSTSYLRLYAQLQWAGNLRSAMLSLGYHSD